MAQEILRISFYQVKDKLPGRRVFAGAFCWIFRFVCMFCFVGVFFCHTPLPLLCPSTDGGASGCHRRGALGGVVPGGGGGEYGEGPTLRLPPPPFPLSRPAERVRSVDVPLPSLEEERARTAQGPSAGERGGGWWVGH